MVFFVCQAEDGIRDLVRSRGLGNVYKRRRVTVAAQVVAVVGDRHGPEGVTVDRRVLPAVVRELSLIHI